MVPSHRISLGVELLNATERRLAGCQRVIGYYFSNSDLLEVALTHSSLRAPDRECNERLEFLGDSILGLVASIQIASQKMVKIGDWIQVPKHDADGKVQEITLNILPTALIRMQMI